MGTTEVRLRGMQQIPMHTTSRPSPHRRSVRCTLQAQSGNSRSACVKRVARRSAGRENNQETLYDYKMPLPMPMKGPESSGFTERGASSNGPTARGPARAVGHSVHTSACYANREMISGPVRYLVAQSYTPTGARLPEGDNTAQTVFPGPAPQPSEVSAAADPTRPRLVHENL